MRASAHGGCGGVKVPEAAQQATKANTSALFISATGSGSGGSSWSLLLAGLELNVQHAAAPALINTPTSQARADTRRHRKRDDLRK